MAENFDIAKFLKENSLGSYGILGKYVDLQPLKEMNEDMDDVDAVLKKWKDDPSTDPEGDWRNKPYNQAQASAQDWFDEYEEEGRLDDFYGMSVEELIDALKLFGEDNAQEVAPILHKMINQEDGNMNEPANGGQASLELDWAAGMPLLKSKCKKHGLTFKVVEEFGPGGGNPLIKIMGPKENIIDWLNDGYVDDEEDLELFVDDIQDESMNEVDGEDLGGWDGNKKYSQYNGKYDDEFGPATANEASNQEKKSTINLDITREEDVEKIQKFCMDNGIKMTDISGDDFQPIYSFKGTKAALSKMIRKYWADSDPEDIISFLYDDNNIDEEVSGVEMEEAQDYEYTPAEKFDMEPQEKPNDPLGPDAPKYPRADFADAVYAANQAGISKDELIRLVNQNAK
jgi:hypothetical protein